MYCRNRPCNVVRKIICRLWFAIPSSEPKTWNVASAITKLGVGSFMSVCLCNIHSLFDSICHCIHFNIIHTCSDKKVCHAGCGCNGCMYLTVYSMIMYVSHMQQSEWLETVTIVLVRNLETKIPIAAGYVTFDTNLLWCVFCCMPYMTFDVVCLNHFVQGTTVVQQTNQRTCSSSFRMCWNLCSLVVKETLAYDFLV
jgi:hypothetical protein